MDFDFSVASNINAQIFEVVRPRWKHGIQPQLKHFAALGEKLDGQLKDRYFPPNLGNCQAAASDIWHAVHDDGLPLVWVPRTELVDQLLTFSTFQERIQFLTSSTEEILQDCENALQDVAGTELWEYKIAAQEAAVALSGGHFRSAQALAANILEASLQDLWDADHRSALRKKGDLTRAGSLKFATFESALECVTDEPEETDLTRMLLHLAAVWHAYGRDQIDHPGPAAARFNRHATAHGIGPSRYTRGTALVAVMLVCSHLRTMQDLIESD